MNPILRNILAVIAGAVLGAFVNRGIINISTFVIPLPEGVNTDTMEGLKAAIPLFQPRNYIMPFLAHALGTLAGAFLTAKLAVNHQIKLAMVVGFLFLAGGIQMIMLLPSPLWFNLLDALGAYIPMALLAGKLALQKK